MKLETESQLQMPEIEILRVIEDEVGNLLNLLHIYLPFCCRFGCTFCSTIEKCSADRDKINEEPNKRE